MENEEDKSLLAIENVDKELGITRDGIPDKKLAAIMASPTLTREQKIVAVNSWLWQNGMENESILGELFLFKGKFGSENHQFKAAMRFDFTLFVSMMSTYLRDSAQSVFNIMSFEQNGFDTLDELRKAVHEFMSKKENEGRNFEDLFHEEKSRSFTRLEKVIFMQMIRDADQADLIDSKIKETYLERAREKGFGTFVDSHGKIYSIFDKDFDEAVANDKAEMEAKIKEQKNG